MSKQNITALQAEIKVFSSPELQVQVQGEMAKA